MPSLQLKGLLVSHMGNSVSNLECPAMATMMEPPVKKLVEDHHPLGHDHASDRYGDGLGQGKDEPSKRTVDIQQYDVLALRGLDHSMADSHVIRNAIMALLKSSLLLDASAHKQPNLKPKKYMEQDMLFSTFMDEMVACFIKQHYFVMAQPRVDLIDKSDNGRDRKKMVNENRIGGAMTSYTNVPLHTTKRTDKPNLVQLRRRAILPMESNRCRRASFQFQPFEIDSDCDSSSLMDESDSHVDIGWEAYTFEAFESINTCKSFLCGAISMHKMEAPVPIVECFERCRFSKIY